MNKTRRLFSAGAGDRVHAYRDDALPAGSLPFRMALAFRNTARRRVSQGFS
jgi:hypothetical protein